MAHFLSGTLAAVKDQLREPSNFYTRAKRAKARISDALAANDVIGARSAAAAYGGVVKQWRRWLIEELTSVALDGVETSRAGVREWQTQMFGQSIASSRLKQYATAERSGGGRAGKITVPDEVERQVQAFYTKHKNAIKLV